MSEQTKRGILSIKHAAVLPGDGTNVARMNKNKVINNTITWQTCLQFLSNI